MTQGDLNPSTRESSVALSCAWVGARRRVRAVRSAGDMVFSGGAVVGEEGGDLAGDGRG